MECLDDVHFIVLPTYPNDLAKEEVDFHRFKTGLENSRKHIVGGIYTIEGLRTAIELGREKAGGKEALRQRPLISVIACVMSPLKMDRTYTQLALEAVRGEVRLVCPTEALCGATVPVTLAGDLVLTNAETLSAAALVQLARRGHPVLYGAVSSIADPRTMQYLSGAVEMGLLNAAAAQLAQFYHLPFYATAGTSDSKLPDTQAGYEKSITALLVALAGANLIHDTAGLLEFATTVALEQYVIDDEINGMVMRALEGIRVDDESLAVEVIDNVGPGGDFMLEEHTLANMRKEFFMPVIADRQLRGRWEEGGAKDTAQRARERVEQILGERLEMPCAG